MFTAEIYTTFILCKEAKKAGEVWPLGRAKKSGRNIRLHMAVNGGVMFL